MEFIENNKILVVSIVMVVAFLVAFKVLKSMKQNKIVTAYSKKDFATYFKEIDSVLGRYFFMEPQREFLKMNAYMAVSDKDSLYEQINYFIKKKMNVKFKSEIALRLFNYFLSLRDVRGTKDSLELLEQTVGKEQAYPNRQMYDIYINKNSIHLDEMLKEYSELIKNEDTDEMLLCQLEVMLGYQYAYNKDKKTAREMLEKAIEHSDSDIYKKGVEQVIKDLKV